MNIHHRLQQHGRNLFFGVALLLGAGGIALATIAPDIQHTRHNLSTSNSITANPGSSFGTTVKAVSETQICVFCHTPHSANLAFAGTGTGPLWNRQLSTATYTFYNSSSLDASPLPGAAGIGDGSKTCLSCHDGTMAIGTIGVLNAQAPNTIAMTGVPASGIMPSGAGDTTGFTRKIGVDLTNDHPISFTFDAANAARDGELYSPGASGVAVANRLRGVARRQFPLIGGADEFGGQMECITCHDPHLKTDEVDPITGAPVDNKFLRGNRFQKAAPVDNGTYNPATDIICLACHNKPTWAGSTHGNPVATSEQYKDSAADLRDFPRNTQVWQSACLACHDIHTVTGARRLLREAVDTPGASPKAGGNSAMEQACYQCHSPPSERALVQDFPDQVPDIKTDFSLPIHMPIVSAEQGQVGVYNGTTEVHDIGMHPTQVADVAAETIDSQRGKDFLETRTHLGAGTGQENIGNRHAECTDCHQPHRLSRTQFFNDDPAFAAESGTHRHAGSGDVGGIPHSNIASGALRGAFGVEPVYTSNSFFVAPSSFVEKRGAPANGASTDVTSTWLTREYQICAKCHSNYGLPNPPAPLGRTGGTPSGTNGLTIYTNVFREIQAPVSHRGNATPGDSGANLTYYAAGRRSWHPVMGPTGRTPALRNASASNWLPPWNNDVGNLTMYCTDCHGTNTAAGTVVPDGGVDGKPWGPHGSTNNFLLKGGWSANTGSPTPNDLCFKCHDYNAYVTGSAGGNSGFGGSGGGNLHPHHNGVLSQGIRCNYCHVSIVHGWKNKALLANLNDIGTETTFGDYYNNAKLAVVHFADSGAWDVNDCGTPGNVGLAWMHDGNACGDNDS